MTTISLRLSDSWHAQVRELAKQDGVSINQYITLALAEKISALTAENYLAVRAQRGSKTKFRAAMSKVSKAPPSNPRDRL
jgi:hypothetical protein